MTLDALVPTLDLDLLEANRDPGDETDAEESE